jgi:hypothetical protein
MEDLIKLLHQGNYSCVISNHQIVRTFSQRGVADLYQLVCSEPSFLKGAVVVDKVVGKGAAALMVKGEIQKVYTDLISEPAFDLLCKAGILVFAGKSVPAIKNRDQTDLCPLEKKCLQVDSVEQIFPLIESFV